ncbi:8297_t:CDS:2 [Paraglomus occultum]|uniref:8297_t:CDS:1 n=1 Tax=Paraglomus occultum TaxID=144539 RepID=A0A9N9BYV5_9GLOM|nr:8297_t:CDS:2 [Paraglomus occultum]
MFRNRAFLNIRPTDPTYRRKRQMDTNNEPPLPPSDLRVVEFVCKDEEILKPP